MSGLTLFTRLVLRLADRIAGPEREEWVLAMASETDAAGPRGTAWAFGCLGAAVRDRVARDRWFYVALFALPIAALASLLASSAILFALDRALDLGDGIIVLLFLAPLPFAALIGRMRPTYPALITGSLSFLAYEAGPAVTMAIMSGRPPIPWSPNLVVYNLPASTGLALAYATWLAAVWLGAAARRSHAGRA